MAMLSRQVCSEGLVYVRVTRTGKASALQQIVRLVEQAQVGGLPHYSAALIFSGRRRTCFGG